MSVNMCIYRVLPSEISVVRQASEMELEHMLFGPDGRDTAPDRVLYLEKAWEAVNFVLDGRGGADPMSFLASDAVGEEIDYEFTYGMGRLIEPALVKQIATGMSGLLDASLQTRLSDKRSMGQLYPFTLREYGREDRDWVMGTFSELKTFVERAAQSHCGLIVGSY